MRARNPSRAVVSAVIPCLNEADAIGGVVASVLAQGVAEVIVVDGGSRDATVEHARAAGARVVVEPRRGYGLAVQRGITQARRDADILLFIDGDGSDRTELIPQLIAPIAEGRAIFTHGSRVKGEREPGSLSFAQIVAGRLAGLLIHLIYRVKFTDMSPFRAIRRDALERLGMQETGFGWNLEMLMRVAAAGLGTQEIAVGQRRRIGGVSKVSGNPIVGLKAAIAIVTTFIRLAASLRRAGVAQAASEASPASTPEP